MTPEEQRVWQEADRLFAELLDLEPAERAGRLAALAPEPELRQCVEQLLRAEESDSGLDDGPDLAAPLAPGSRFGPWEIEEPVGRGGMATVYRVRRPEADFEQVGALKLLQLSQMGPDGQARFGRETRILAGLSHPHIAGLLDAGVAGDGTPYLVMEFVDGEPIDAFVARHELDRASRVALFCEVCDAAAFAQQNLVVHRDIKPSNILVDAQGRARLLDFGIARLLADAEEDRTTTRIFTPGYCAPEQMTGERITTATDVFGLGAVLYGLLTGERAFSGEPGARWKPPRPPREIDGTIDRDLQNITLKALREEPARRYPTAEALLADLRAWQQGRTVSATPDSMGYRIRKLVARNRGAAVATVFALAAALAGVSATVWQAREARAQATLAQHEADTARAVVRVLQGLIGTLAPSTPGASSTDPGRVLDEARAGAVEELGDRPTALADVEFALGQVAHSLGLYERSRLFHGEALALRRQEIPANPVAVASSELMLARIGDSVGDEPAEVTAAFERALGALAEHDPGSETFLRGTVEFAAHLGNRDDPARAREVLGEALRVGAERGTLEDAVRGDILVMQSQASVRLGDFDQAVTEAQAAVAALEAAHGTEHARVARGLGVLGDAQLRGGDLDAGLATLAAAVDLDRRTHEQPNIRTLDTLGSYVVALQQTGRIEEALPLELERLEQARTVLGDPSGQVAYALGNLGNLHMAVGRFEEARAFHLESEAAYAAVYGDGHAGALIGRTNAADALREEGRADEAREIALATLPAFEATFGADSPRVIGLRAKITRAELLLGLLDEAEAQQQEVIAARIAHSGEDHYRTALDRGWLAEIWRRQGRHDDALELIEASLPAIIEALGPTHRYSAPPLVTRALLLCPASPDCANVRAEAEAALGPAYPAGHWLRLAFEQIPDAR